MMDYWPNVDAVIWLAQTVLPRVREVRPSTTFWIVGANPTHAVRNLVRLPGVFVTGRVPDVRPYLAHAAAAVAPLRVARGTQTKVLEAMSMGRPVVASSPAFEGLRVRAGRDLIVADNADQFVRAIEAVLVRESGDALGRCARQAVRSLYAWNDQFVTLDEVVERAERSLAGSRNSPKTSLTVCS
jgi:glycosyltransferase involved in cell wall biosynthesis